MPPSELEETYYQQRAEAKPGGLTHTIRDGSQTVSRGCVDNRAEHVHQQQSRNLGPRSVQRSTAHLPPVRRFVNSAGPEAARTALTDRGPVVSPKRREGYNFWH